MSKDKEFCWAVDFGGSLTIILNAFFKIENQKLVSHVWEGVEDFGSPVT
jgi:hypothetical protein